jgi:hypothetical protein
MSAVASLRTAVGALRRQPVLLIAGLCYGLVVLPQRALQLAGVPVAPTLLQMLTFFITPFVIAGVVGMARTALDDDASLDTLATVGKAQYVDLLLATLVEFGIKLAFGIVLVVVGIALVVVGGSGTGAVVVAAIAVVVALVYLATLLSIQFYPVIVVVDDAGPVEAVTDSVAFVRSNLVGTLGFSAVTVLVGALAALPVVGVAAYRFATAGVGSGGRPGPIGGGMGSRRGGGTGMGTVDGAPALGDAIASGGLGLSTPEVAALSLVSMAATAVVVAFRLTYATAFYRSNGRSIEAQVLGDEW